MLDRDGIVAERSRNIDVKAKLRQQHLRAPAHLALQNHAEARRLAAEKQILRHRNIRQQVDLLIDGGDACIERGLGRARGDIDAVEANNSTIACEYAGDHLDQGGFAGAVLPEQRVNFAGAEGEIDILQRAQRAKTLAEPAHLKKRPSRIGATIHGVVAPAGVRNRCGRSACLPARRFG